MRARATFYQWPERQHSKDSSHSPAGPATNSASADPCGTARSAKANPQNRGTLKAGRVRDVRFNDLRHTFGTRAAAGVLLRTLQEWIGHREFKTTLIDADYCPSAHEGEMVTRAFRLEPNLSETVETSGDLESHIETEST